MNDTTWRDATPADAEAIRRHPLATQAGAMMMTELIIADRHLARCTPAHRRLLAKLCPPAIEAFLSAGRLTAADLPVIPADVPTRTVMALKRRGLARDGRLTAAALHAWYWQVWRQEQRESVSDGAP